MLSVRSFVPRGTEGFSLVEVLVATALLASALASLGQVFTVATTASIDARNRTFETIFAAQKIEQFRASAFDDQEPGEFVEYLDIMGRMVDASAADDGLPAYTRRWAIESLPADPVNTVVVSVTVSKYQPGDSTSRGAVRLVTLKTRKGR